MEGSGGKNDGNYSYHPPLRSTHSYRCSRRTKVVNAANGKGEPRDKFVKLQLVLILICGSILVSSSREGVRTLRNRRFGDGHLKRQDNTCKTFCLVK